MTTPTTEAGRTLAAAFIRSRGDDLGSIPLRPVAVVQAAVPRIEAEAARDALLALRAEVEAWRDGAERQGRTADDEGEANRMAGAVVIARTVLAAIDRRLP